MERVFLIHQDTVSSDAALCDFTKVTKNCLTSGGTSSVPIFIYLPYLSLDLYFVAVLVFQAVMMIPALSLRRPNFARDSPIRLLLKVEASETVGMGGGGLFTV